MNKQAVFNAADVLSKQIYDLITASEPTEEQIVASLEALAHNLAMVIVSCESEDRECESKDREELIRHFNEYLQQCIAAAPPLPTTH